MTVTSTAALIPALLAIDRRVLDALERDRGKRAADVAGVVHGAKWWRCTACAREVPCHDRHGGAWRRGEALRCLDCLERADWRPADVGRTLQPVTRTTPAQCREVLEILHGLERVGQAVQARGWWRRAA